MSVLHIDDFATLETIKVNKKQMKQSKKMIEFSSKFEKIMLFFL